jgi:hypothetical protein
LVVMTAFARLARAQPTTSSPLSPEDIANLLSRSTFVFTAAVESRGGTTVAGVRPSPDNVIVRVRAGVDTVIARPPGFVSLVGRRITLVSAPEPVPQETLVFASFHAAAGSEIALRVHSTADAAPPLAQGLMASVAAAIDLLAQRGVAARVAQAAIVALVRVDSVVVNADDVDSRPTLLSVERAFKGAAAGARLLARTPVAERIRSGAVFPVSPGTQLLALIRYDSSAVAIPLLLFDRSDVLAIADTVRVKRALGLP